MKEKNFLLRVVASGTPRDNQYLLLCVAMVRSVVVGVARADLCDNCVRNTRYRWFSFVPLVVWSQFSRWLNRYFLLVAVLQLVPSLSPTSALATWLPLLFILSVAAVRELLDELRAASADRRFNATFGHLRVGEVLRMCEGALVPCDCVLLGSSSTPNQIHSPFSCFVETTLLDGETDWKPRSALSNCGMGTELRVPAPSTDVARFEGAVVTEHQQERQFGLESVLFAGSVVRGLAEGQEAVAVAIYTGVETKMSLNKAEPRQKFTAVDESINSSVLFVFLVQLALAIVFGSIGTALADPAIWYLRLDTFRNPLVYIVRWILLFSIFIPISLYVTVTVAKYWLSVRIGLDCKANNTSVIDDLGCCQSVCCDKTGTITRNIMSLEDSFCTMEEEEEEQGSELFVAVCLCSSVQLLPSGEFLASSPDELALVQAAAARGVRLVARKGDKVCLELSGSGVVAEFIVLETLPFVSERRRMSVLVRRVSDGAMLLYSKGSDDALIPRLRSSSSSMDTARSVEQMADRGLRTLVVASRRIDDEALQRSGVLSARASLDGGRALEQSFESLERLMNAVGCVGIRDQLQANASETLEQIRSSRSLWIISGDKKQTLVALARSCALPPLCDLDGDGAFGNHQSDSEVTLHLSGSQFEVLSAQQLARFAKAPCVLVSRSSPSQKAAIVQMLQSHKLVVCAIGDGGNDVSMIRVANVGIGLSGKEGAQAAIAADFAVPSFFSVCHLLEEGRLAHARIIFISLFCFFKSFLLASVQLFFASQSMFSGVSLFSTLQLMLYNVFFTSVPVVLRIFDPSNAISDRSYRVNLSVWIARAVIRRNRKKKKQKQKQKQKQTNKLKTSYSLSKSFVNRRLCFWFAFCFLMKLQKSMILQVLHI